MKYLHLGKGFVQGTSITIVLVAIAFIGVKSCVGG